MSNQFHHESVDLASGERISFRWERGAITDGLITAVGIITLEWAMLDQQITAMIQGFWLAERPNEKIPRSFDHRSRILRERADAVYDEDREEWLVFRWYLQRLRDANGKRDAIAHGLPGKITKGRRTYRGLMVPYPSRKPDYVPMATAEVAKLAHTMTHLNAETVEVASTFSAAHFSSLVASSPNTFREHIHGMWKQLGRDHHYPKLPRTIPLPPTFQG